MGGCRQRCWLVTAVCGNNGEWVEAAWLVAVVASCGWWRIAGGGDWLVAAAVGVNGGWWRQWAVGGG
ncbi:hypothetical protein HanRHA438_Chr09g0411851 [Helianthus annuus]|nr:hypothetical protein HanRHA438_Chr09g0411851 [Helianthus annuus]